MINYIKTYAIRILLIALIVMLGALGYKIAKNSLDKLAVSQHVTTASITTTEPLPSQELTKSDVESIVKEYILNNPEIMIQSLENLQALRTKEHNEKIALKISARRSELQDTTSFPSIGLEKGVKIIVFFDYNCGYCKKANTALNELMATEENMQIIYHLTPILGEGSNYLAKIALAVNKLNKDKFKLINDTLMSEKIENKEDVANILEKNGIDFAKIEGEIESGSVQKILDKSTSLTKYIGVSAVPAIIINDTLYPGFLDKEQLVKIVQEAKQKPLENN